MIYLVRLAFFILIVNLSSNALKSQDLTFDVNYASDEVLVGEDSVGVFYGSIINTSSENINIRILKGAFLEKNNGLFLCKKGLFKRPWWPRCAEQGR